MTSQPSPGTAMGSKIVVVAILVASLILVPELTGSERIVGLVGSAMVAGVAAFYARQRQALIGSGWMWFSLAIAALWLIGLGVLLFAPLPPGGSKAT